MGLYRGRLRKKATEVIVAPMFDSPKANAKVAVGGGDESPSLGSWAIHVPSGLFRPGGAWSSEIDPCNSPLGLSPKGLGLPKKCSELWLEDLDEDAFPVPTISPTRRA